jgi:hypothetical protein
MTKATIEAIANDAGGIEKIVGLRMANGTKFYFSNYALSLDDFVTLAGNEILKLRHKDTMGGEAVSYLIVEEIVQVYTVLDLEKRIILRDILD